MHRAPCAEVVCNGLPLWHGAAFEVLLPRQLPPYLTRLQCSCGFPSLGSTFPFRWQPLAFRRRLLEIFGGLKRWDEGRWDVSKQGSLYKGSLVPPTFIPPCEASETCKRNSMRSKARPKWASKTSALSEDVMLSLGFCRSEPRHLGGAGHDKTLKVRSEHETPFRPL